MNVINFMPIVFWAMLGGLLGHLDITVAPWGFWAVIALVAGIQVSTIFGK